MHILLALYAGLSLFGYIFVLRWERRLFNERGLESSWRIVRLSTIPIALLTAALVLLPARSTGGLEGLSVFYLLLILAAPIFWIGAHWLVGRFVIAPLPFRDAARIACSPLLYFIVLALIAQRLQSAAWSLLRSLGLE